jgi:methylglutaconyl-CoA hydratase
MYARGFAATQGKAREADLDQQRVGTERSGRHHFDRLARYEAELAQTARNRVVRSDVFNPVNDGDHAARQFVQCHELFSNGNSSHYRPETAARPAEPAFAARYDAHSPRRTRPPMSQTLQQERASGVVRIRLHRPELHNAFDAALVGELTAVLEATANDPGVRAVILEGSGASFSAGADLNWMRGMAAASEAENRADALALARLMRTLDELPKPTIARVHGAAFGGGLGLVACCDIAIGVPEARFGLTEAQLGLLPAVISPYVIGAIGARNARRYFATGEIFDATEALRIGLLHQVVAADQLDAAVQRQLDLLLRAGPIASAKAKQLVREVAAHADGKRHDADNAALIARLRISPEGQEGIGAFLDKRKPSWTD